MMTGEPYAPTPIAMVDEVSVSPESEPELSDHLSHSAGKEFSNDCY